MNINYLKKRTKHENHKLGKTKGITFDMGCLDLTHRCNELITMVNNEVKIPP